MEIFFLLDIIIKFAVLKSKVYSISKQKYKEILFFPPPVINFIFPLERFVACSPRYLWYEARKHKKGGETSSLYIYNHL